MVVNEFQMTEKDLAAFSELKQAVERRGPKPADEAGKYTVTCLDEVISYSLNAVEKPMVCVNCGGSNILSRRGELPTYQEFDQEHDDDRYIYWQRSRFSGGRVRDTCFSLEQWHDLPRPESPIHPAREASDFAIAGRIGRPDAG